MVTETSEAAFGAEQRDGYIKVQVIYCYFSTQKVTTFLTNNFRVLAWFLRGSDVTYTVTRFLK